MKRCALVIVFFICCLTTSVCFAAEPLAGISFDQPLEISSERLAVYQNEQKTVFSGQVEAVQGDFKLTTDRLTVFYNQEQSQIARLEADGSVQVVQLDREASADHARFIQAEQLLVLTGNAILRQGSNQVAGEEIIFDLAKNTSIVKSSAGGRVKATILPPTKKESSNP